MHQPHTGRLWCGDQRDEHRGRFLSSVKGGRLAEAAGKARQISLYISDVNNDDLSTVSSGLTLPGNTTRSDFDRIVAKYDLLDKFPRHVAALTLLQAHCLKCRRLKSMAHVRITCCSTIALP
ncbi:MAG: DUF4147 domain-containing protein [Acidobacteria bacterium]|nr:DUF4147 domain-containing protein [Acidobacteriota bacterium]